MDAPSETNIAIYYKELEKFGVTDVVRVCDPTYSKEYLLTRGIRVHDWTFPDGEAPPPGIIQRWLELVSKTFPQSSLGPSSSSGSLSTPTPMTTTPSPSSQLDPTPPEPTLAVHCIAGLGRAPVLVALALIEAGMEPLDCVAFIRAKRRGAINQNQLKFLESYSKRKKSKSSCTMM